MSLASSIITRAYREGQITALVSAPNTNEQNEALPLLNSLILSSVGFEAGQELSDLNIGGSYDQSFYCSTWIPENARLILNLAGAETFKLHPHPHEGQRLGVTDALANLATNNLTLDGNGRTIEGVTSLVLNTSGDSRQWLYRSDTANWVKITSLATTDSMPFPEDYDDYFVIKLAMRLFPRNGVAMTKESAAALQRTENALKARYRKPRVQDSFPRGLLNQQRGSFDLTQGDFNAGRTFR